ncbi:S8 family peptidase [Frondihabitans australicus]|uniref:Type VII secretion-associated serine protease mycosin n=1 Tax=Frondihabitans australicus TaxID=386892 RepID=A0A495IGE1_9MICO|nr:S8 family serine peptidase [Frondihabitans australicus]RKR75014.1 type VII secretion-associated serine protease mycosin [Frondihabitans australicus]
MRRPLALAGFVAAVAIVLLSGGVLTAQPARADDIRSREYWLQDYGIEQAWNTTKGKGVTVAVIDTGVDGSVSELQGAVTGGTDFSGQGSSNGQTPIDDSGDSSHGTLVASMLAGRGTGTDSGVIGVAPQASILSISVGFGASAHDPDEQIAEAVVWAVNHGAKVINMSLTRNTLDWPVSWDRAFEYADAHGVVVVAAAGNRGSGTDEVGAPATMPGVLAVAGVDQNGDASYDASSQGITIGVAAPSEGLVGVGPGGQYLLWQGTSGAAPIVSGIAALVYASHPGISADDVIQRIISTATPKGSPSPGPIYGHGLVNAERAVTANVAHVTSNPLGSLSDWVRLHRRAAATPLPTAKPQPSLPVTATPTTAVANRDVDAGGFPTVESLRSVGIPVAVYAVFGISFAAVVIGAARHFRRLRSGR